jgi:hypothetical protein
MTDKIYDAHCAWPYIKPYGMVAAPKIRKPRRPRKSRAKPDWLKKKITRKRQLEPRRPYSELTPKGGVKKAASSSTSRTQPPAISQEQIAAFAAAIAEHNSKINPKR